MSFPSASSTSMSAGPARRGTTPPPSYIRTNRVSCDPCRKRKLKCDRVKPCSTCTKRGIPHQCYQEEGEGRQQEIAPMDSAKRPRKEGTASTSASSFTSDSRSPKDTPERVHIAAKLAKCKDEMDALAKMASQSSMSLEGMLTDLSSGDVILPANSTAMQPESPPSLKAGELVVWSHVCSHLPAVEDCEALIAFYFEELCSYFRMNQRHLFEKQWRLLLDGTGIGQTEASIIFTAFALADIMVPSASTIRRHSREDHHRWMSLLGDPKSSPLGKPVDNSFPKIHLLCLTGIYHLYEGRTDHLWECVGVAMRRGIIHGLFDERSKSWLDLSNLDREYRRRLAWYLLLLDRWQAFVRQLPFALDPTQVFLAEPSFEADSRIQHNYAPARIIPNRPTLALDGRLQLYISPRRPTPVKFVFVELLDWCQDYLSHFASMSCNTRYSRALLLDNALERVLLDGLHHTGIEQKDLHFLSTSILDKCVKERQVEMTSFISSIFFLRCIITRRFLTDDNAPSHLRFVSLTYAQGIMATIPSLTRLIKEGQASVQLTGNANQLLAAATTFTVVILGQDHYVESQSNPLEADTEQQIYREGFPHQHLKWLAENVFDTLDCLETLVTRGNHSAAVAIQLLKRLCMAHGDLRELYQLRFSRITGSEKPHHPIQRHEPMPDNFNTQHNHMGLSIKAESAELHPTAFQPVPKKTAMATSDIFSTGSSSSIYPWYQSLAQPMSASSLLAAVLSDPTEVDLLGNDNMNLLATILKDSPPV